MFPQAEKFSFRRNFFPRGAIKEPRDVVADPSISLVRSARSSHPGHRTLLQWPQTLR